MKGLPSFVICLTAVSAGTSTNHPFARPFSWKIIADLCHFGFGIKCQYFLVKQHSACLPSCINIRPGRCEIVENQCPYVEFLHRGLDTISNWAHCDVRDNRLLMPSSMYVLSYRLSAGQRVLLSLQLLYREITEIYPIIWPHCDVCWRQRFW